MMARKCGSALSSSVYVPHTNTANRRPSLDVAAALEPTASEDCGITTLQTGAGSSEVDGGPPEAISSRTGTNGIGSTHSLTAGRKQPPKPTVVPDVHGELGIRDCRDAQLVCGNVLPPLAPPKNLFGVEILSAVADAPTTIGRAKAPIPDHSHRDLPPVEPTKAKPTRQRRQSRATRSSTPTAATEPDLAVHGSGGNNTNTESSGTESSGSSVSGSGSSRQPTRANATTNISGMSVPRDGTTDSGERRNRRQQARVSNHSRGRRDVDPISTSPVAQRRFASAVGSSTVAVNKNIASGTAPTSKSVCRRSGGGGSDLVAASCSRSSSSFVFSSRDRRQAKGRETRSGRQSVPSADDRERCVGLGFEHLAHVGPDAGAKGQESAQHGGRRQLDKRGMDRGHATVNVLKNASVMGRENRYDSDSD
jgi:hypothetical protein